MGPITGSAPHRQNSSDTVSTNRSSSTESVWNRQSGQRTPSTAPSSLSGSTASLPPAFTPSAMRRYHTDMAEFTQSKLKPVQTKQQVLQNLDARTRQRRRNEIRELDSEAESYFDPNFKPNSNLP